MQAFAQAPASSAACNNAILDVFGGQTALDILNGVASLDSTANTMGRMADETAKTRTKSLETDSAQAQAEQNYRLNEKTNRLLYCERCNRAKAYLDASAKKFASACPNGLPIDAQMAFGKQRKWHTEFCVLKQPYDTLCNQK